jgi:hypothetical protein
MKLSNRKQGIVFRAAILILALLSALSFWAVPPAFAQTSTVTFSDVPSSYWAYPFIEAIYNAGITIGCGSGDYCPSEDVTRDEMAAFIIRAVYGENFTYNTTPYFTDVPATDYFFPYIQKMKDMNITTMSGTYMPSDPVTRDEMAAFLARARQVKAGQGAENFTYTATPYFTDVPATDPYFPYVQNLKDNGITTVTGTYDPDEIVPRDQMAAFIARAFLANNVLSVTVNGSQCDSSINNGSPGYTNEPCVSVTVCTPGTFTCVTINSILLDTGSFGLRLFKQVLGSVSLPQVTAGSGSLAECVQYADNTSEWGPVQMASVSLGNEPAVQVPIQVIDSTFGAIPSSCGPPDYTTDTQPSDEGFNGILGIGPLVQDCGTECATDPGNEQYYSCTGSTCTGTIASVQVSNPVASFPVDNNGLIVELPDVLSGGQPSVGGIVVFGIGTSFNNSPSSVTTYPLDGYGDFITTFNGITYSDATAAADGSFIDTGSNALFLPPTSITPDCQDNPGWFCPTSTQSLSAIIEGASGSPTNTVPFQIGNFDTLTNSVNNVFFDLGGDNPTFDWGLPFYFGSNIYIGFDGISSSLGTGPYFAY